MKKYIIFIPKFKTKKNVQSHVVVQILCFIKMKYDKTRFNITT